jgi:hypothetical protein
MGHPAARKPMTLSRLSHVRKTKIIAPITRTLAVKGTKRLL